MLSSSVGKGPGSHPHSPQGPSNTARGAWTELPQERQPGDINLSPVAQSLGRIVGKGRRQRQRDKDPDLQESL